MSPPAMLRDSSAVGSKLKLKMTTTSRAKNSMLLIASLDRHSRRKSLARVERVTASNEGVLVLTGVEPEVIGKVLIGEPRQRKGLRDTRAFPVRARKYALRK